MVRLGEVETDGGGADPVIAFIELIRELAVQDGKEKH